VSVGGGGGGGGGVKEGAKGSGGKKRKIHSPAALASYQQFPFQHARDSLCFPPPGSPLLCICWRSHA